MMSIAWNTVIFLVLIIGGIALQFALSKANSKWPGLVLPAICVLFSLMAVAGNFAYSGMSNGSLALDDMARIVVIIGLFNIPTIILMGIYAAVRGKKKTISDVDKMKLHELE